MFYNCDKLEDFLSSEIKVTSPIEKPYSELILDPKEVKLNQTIDTINLNYLSGEDKNKRIINDLSHMFDGCSSLLKFGALSTWNSNNIKNMSYMFNNCVSLISLPDLSQL